MPTSAFVQYEDIEPFVDARNSCLLDDVHKSILKEIIDFLEPFQESSDKWEQDKHPTLPFVLSCFAKLSRHLHVEPIDSNMNTELKYRAKHFLGSKLQIEEVHRVATLLCPQFCHFRMLRETKRKAVHDNVRERIASLRGDADVRENSRRQLNADVSASFKSGAMQK